MRGTGIGEVVAIDALSETGKIGQSLSTLETKPPRLAGSNPPPCAGIRNSRGAVSVLAVLLYGTLRGGGLDAVLAGIALGMSMLPEAFPVVLTVFMAMGAWRISRARVLTRRAAAIETLGSATMLEPFHDLAGFGVLASAQDPFDPMEKAFHDVGREYLAGSGHIHGSDWKLVHGYGFALAFSPCRRSGGHPAAGRRSSSRQGRARSDRRSL